MNNKKPVGVIVLAAGKGTRMKSDMPKVLHEVCGEPMLKRVLDAVRTVGPRLLLVITGHGGALVEKIVAETMPVVKTARQAEQLGTANAVAAGREEFSGFNGTIMIVCGDTPLLRGETLAAFLANHRSKDAVISVLTTRIDDPCGYGRIIRGEDGGTLVAIVEERDGSDEQLRINEVNTGVYCVESDFLWQGIERIDSDNSQNEFYLTDLVNIAFIEGHMVIPFVCLDPDEVVGVNSVGDLARAEEIALSKNP